MTEEQRQVVECDKDIVLVNAIAGSGKTTTLHTFCERRRDKKILYLVYNRSMKEDADKKFKDCPNVDVYTIHGLAKKSVFDNGLSEAKAFYEKHKNNEINKEGITKDFILNELKVESEVVYQIKELYEVFTKSEKDLDSFLNEIEGDANIMEKYFCKDALGFLVIKERLARLWTIASSFNEAKNKKGLIDHNSYLKFYQLSKPTLEYDYILVDEAQDLNMVMFDIVMRQKHAKKVFVGDDYQKIYGFNNCVSAFSLLDGKEGVESLHLTKTFRCPESVLQYSRPYLELLGMEQRVESLAKEATHSVLTPTAYIFRTNAGILDFLLNERDAKPHFVGGIGACKFSFFFDLAKVFSTNEAVKEGIVDPVLRRHNTKEKFKAYLKENDDYEYKQRFRLFIKYMGLEDVNILEFISNLKNYPKKEASVIVTTAHKSKGLEWDHICIGRDFPKFVSYAEEKRVPREKKISKEELSLMYVAITRGKVSIQIPEEYQIEGKREEVLQRHIFE